MDQIARQALVSKLQGHMKKASSNVRTSLVAEKDDFKVVLSSKDLKQYYKGIEVGSTKVAELDDDVIEFINDSPDDAAQEMLEGFRQSFDEEAFNRAAESNQKTEKTAAHATQDEKTHDMITQKQFDEQKPSLHPRTDEYYSNITQKQLPEHGQRPGTYDQVTEGQFRDERTTFYGADRTAGDWKQEDRNTVTERQFEEGTKEYSDVGESDRGEMGSKFDGGLEQQWRVIGEKQLMELLKHHEWTEPLTTTEGPDQLQKQDGELSRLTADVARSIVKEALQALGNTVVSAGVTPQDLSGIVRRLVSHPSKYPVLANVIRCYTGADTSAIDKKVAKARYFGKVANADKDFSDSLIADVFVRQLAAMNYNPQFIVDGLVALAESEDIADRIDSACENCLKGKPVTDEKKAENVDIFRTVISGKEETKADAVSGDDSDGFYSYEGPLSEVNASIDNKDAFKKAATDFARERVLVAAEKDIDLIPQSLDVNAEDGTYVIVFYDPTHKEAELKARAEARRKLVKEADTKEAQMGGAGGMPPAAGPEMGNPMAPPGGADMGAPPAGEALSQEPPMPDEGMDDGGSGEPQPPGTICDICGSQDVDVDNGEWRCNNCGGEGEIYVMKKTTKWPGTIEETETDEGEGFGLGAEEELGDLGPAPEEEMGEGAGTTLPNVPVGASVKNVLTKLASKNQNYVFASKFRITPRTAEVLKKQKISLGSVCPNCGGNNTDSTKIAGGQAGICWSCGQEYKWRVLANRNKKNSVYAQYIWSPKTAEENCSGCNRLREAFDEALKEYGVTREEFDNLGDITAQAPFVLKMANAGVLDGLVDVMNEDLPLNKVAASARWKGSEKFDKFPSASCIERIARRFGENATAMSGPCEGKNLANCICSQLEGLGIYSDGVAAKVAKTMLDENPMVNSPIKTCVAMLVRDGMDMDNACVACDALRAAHADVDDLVIEAIAQFAPAEMSAKPMAPKPMAPKPMAPKPMAPKPMTGPKPMSAPTDGMKPMAPKPMSITPGEPTMPMSEPEGPVSGPGMNPGAGPGMGQGKPMPEPMDEPITDATEIGTDLPGGEVAEVEMEIEPGFGDEMGGGFDDGFGGLDNESLGLEMGEGTVTIQLPEEAMDALQVLFDALQGQIGDEFVEEIPTDDGLDVGDITDETVDEGDEGTEESEEGGIPGLADDDSTPDDDFGGDESEEFGGGEEEDTSDAEPMLHKKTEDKDCGAKPCGTKPMSDDNSQAKPMKMEAKPMRNNQEVVAPVAESDAQMQKEAQVTPQNGQDQQLENMLFNMKRGSLRTTQSALDNLFDGIMRQAEMAKTAADNDVKKMDYKSGDEGSKVNVTPAQDSSEVKFKDGGKIGHEQAFTEGVKTKPDVPRAAATMGDEDESNTVSESSNLPKVPHGSPAMAGEEHYRPEKGNVVDGNQGGKKSQSRKTTKEAVYVSGEDEKGNPIYVKDDPNQTVTITDKGTNVTPKPKPKPKGKTAKSQEKSMKVANTVWTVQKGHQHYTALQKKANAGDWVVKLQDGKTYDMSTDQSGNFVLIAQNSSEIKKESQTKTPNKVDTLVDDPDINQSSGPGKGKTHADEAHSLAVTEKKPSEGMDEPSIPEADNKGQLTREHTYDNELNGPEIPAGGGMNPDYDENEKNTPEKQDQMLGKQDGGAALASHDEAVKIAGQMVKANLITIDELPAKVQELSRVPKTALKDYERLIAVASSKKGLQKESSAGAVETAFVQKTAATDESNNLKDDIQSLFRLDQRNRDHEKWSQDKGNTRLFH